MNIHPTTPTEELYSALQVAYNHFNNSLFDAKLPPILFTFQRQQGMMGYFAPNRWASSQGKNCHEIAINPLYVGRAKLIELMQTLVHEMTHCWQHCYGTPGRMSYHNKEWSDKMISVGLMPTSTGKPGGKIVGQRMGDYPISNGSFVLECVTLLNTKNFNLPWVDRFSIRDWNSGNEGLNESCENTVLADALTGIDSNIADQLISNLSHLFDNDLFESPSPQSSKKTKLKYTCFECGINVWGKAGLSLRCDDCNIPLQGG
ncbi:TPA: SprT-like domain-containing protein [Legionella anisa]|nr:sprT domain-containing protein [Legionella pneumophila]